MRLQFILSETMHGLRRNISMVVSVVLVTFVSLGFVGVAALMQIQVNQMKDYWFDKVEVSIFLCADGDQAATCAEGKATEAQRDSIEEDLKSDALTSYVEDYYFESKEEAYQHLVEQYGEERYAGVTADEMGESFRVKLRDPSKYQVVAEMFTGRDGIVEVKDQREIFGPLIKVLNGLTWLSIGLAAVMLVAAVLLITTTIRLSAMSRRRETGIMRLVGASNLFIQLPFMLEGVIAALIGAVLAVVGLWAGVHFMVGGWLSNELTIMDYVTSTQVWQLAPFLILGGIVLAALSSLVTLRRYTKV